VKPTIKVRCGCDDPTTGRTYARGKCPKLGTRGHGAWEWRLTVPTELQPLVGKKELSGSGFRTRKEAENAAGEAIAKVRAGEQHIGTLTVGAYLDQWLAGKRRLRPSTRRNYETAIRLYLRPLIGAVPLAGLRKHHVDAMIVRIEEGNTTRRRKVGPKTIAEIYGTLRTALNDAVDHRLISHNPCSGVDLPERDTPEIEPWDARDVGRFLDEAAGDPHSAMYELAALCGLRRGELAGLAWDDLEIDPRTADDEDGPAGVLTVRRQITDSGGTVGVWAPKTRSGWRRVDLDPTTLGSLLAHRLRQDAERELVGPAWDNGTLPDQSGKPVELSGLMFTRPDGRHLAPEYVTSHMWHIAKRVGLCCHLVRTAEAGDATLTVGNRLVDPVGTWTLYVDREPVGQVTVTACQKRRGAGAVLTLAEPLLADLPRGAELGRDVLPRRRLHDLRHSSASIQLAEGIELTLVSKRLGHSSPSITGTLYAHLLRPAGQAAARKVRDAVPRANSGQAPGRQAVPGGSVPTPAITYEINVQVADAETGGPSGTRTLNSPVKRRPPARVRRGGVWVNPGVVWVSASRTCGLM